MPVRWRRSTPAFVPFRLRPSRFLQLSAFAVVVWLVDSLGFFQPIDGPAYDLFMRLRSHYQPAPAQVLLLTTTNEAEASENLASLLRQLRTGGATAIVFNFLPPFAGNEKFYDEVTRTDNVLFGRAMRPLAESTDLFEYEPGPIGVPIDDLPIDDLIVGGVAKPRYEGGVYRSQYVVLDTLEGSVPSLEVAAATHLRGTATLSTDDTFLIDFRGGPGSLPTLAVGDARTGDLIPELVSGKCVLIGSPPSSTDVGLYTPTTSRQETFSLHEYQGHALNSLLTARSPTSLSRAKLPTPSLPPRKH